MIIQDLTPHLDLLEKEATQAQVKVFILDNMYRALPRPAFTETETDKIAKQVYDYVWERSRGGYDLLAA